MALGRTNNYANKFRSLPGDRGLAGLGLGVSRAWGRVRSLPIGHQIGGHATFAFLVTALAGTNNDLRFQATSRGSDGNDITVTYVDPPGNNAALGVVVTGTDIVVNLATDGSSVITSTAAQVRTAILASTPAARLVSVEHATGNDGTGLVTALAETALAGGTDLVSDTPTLTEA